MATYSQLSYAQQVSEHNTSYLHPQQMWVRLSHDHQSVSWS